MTILLVDDMADSVRMLQNLLDQSGFKHTECFASAQELFDYLNSASLAVIERDVDLIVMDMMMPRMTGVEACRTLKERRETL